MRKQLPLLILTAVLAVIVLSQYRSAIVQAQQAKQDYVYTVCNESRMSATINERECGELQDELHVEFLCTEANTLPTNHCWTEAK